NGESLTSAGAVYDNTNSVGGTSTVNLSGGGKIIFDNFTSFNPSTEFAYTTNSGPVHA
ncbi:MAG: hypothetical protein JO264_15960, partial [Acidisphaera sp.]|nr:hypothetical protein [Acidisphaera sp.]